MIWLRQSTSVVVSFGPAVLNTDGVTLVTNLTGTGANQTENTSTGIRLSKNGGALAARHAAAGASTYDALGNYLVPLDATDTGTLGTLRMQYADAAHFLPLFLDMMVINTALWDALFAGSGGAIPNLVAGATNGLFIAGTNAATAITTSLTTTFTGNLTGSVGTVTGLTASNLDATISSRLASAGYTVPPTAVANADALLDRDMSTGTDSGSTTVRTPRQALRFLRNKWTVATAALTVYKEDDTTSSWTGTVSTDAAAVPIVGNDPAG